MQVIAKNTTSGPAVAVELTGPGVTIPASGQYVLNPTEYATWAEAIEESPDSELVDYLQDGSITMNNGTDNLSVADGINFVKNASFAKGTHFDKAVSDNTSTANTLQEFINQSCAPDTSQKPAYLSNGEVDYVEFFKGATQTTPNRISRVDMVYSGDDPQSETWKVYDTSDGVTVLKTVTFTHTWSANDLTGSTMVTT